MKTKRFAIYNKCNGNCGYCGNPLQYQDMQVDHIISQSTFYHSITNNFHVPDFLSHLTVVDVNHIDNLMPSCRSCNNFKKTFHLELFRAEISEQIKRLRQWKPTFRLAERFGLIECKPKEIKFYFELHKA